MLDQDSSHAKETQRFLNMFFGEHGYFKEDPRVKKKCRESGEIPLKVWSKDEKIDVTSWGDTMQLLPVEFHIKEDGSLDNSPSFAIVLASSNGQVVVGQLSLAKLRPVFEKMEELERKKKILEGALCPEENTSKADACEKTVTGPATGAP